MKAEKSVAQEAEALTMLANTVEAHGGLAGQISPAIVAALRSGAKALAEQHRLEAENRSLREALREIGQEAMLTASDPHLPASKYRERLNAVSTLALKAQDSQ